MADHRLTKIRALESAAQTSMSKLIGPCQRQICPVAEAPASKTCFLAKQTQHVTSEAGKSYIKLCSTNMNSLSPLPVESGMVPPLVPKSLTVSEGALSIGDSVRPYRPYLASEIIRMCVCSRLHTTYLAVVTARLRAASPSLSAGAYS
jgi:hypothetical protein